MSWRQAVEYKRKYKRKMRIIIHALRFYRRALEAEPFTNPDIPDNEKLYFHLLRKQVDELIHYYKTKMENK
jgi:uncharacterized protein (DUF1697 family)